MTESCENCRFSKKDDDSEGCGVFCCRRYPPDEIVGFPAVFSADWCGEYQAKGDARRHTNARLLK